MLGFRERAPALQCKLVYRGYELAIKQAPSGWRVGIYPRTADLPILRRCGRSSPAIKTRPYWWRQGDVDGAYLP